jgi:hypothetical protein
VTPTQDPQNPRRLIVTISAPVATFFARIVGMTQVTVSVTSRAEYALPVPMGSPQSYLGIHDTARAQGVEYVIATRTRSCVD